MRELLVCAELVVRAVCAGVVVLEGTPRQELICAPIRYSGVTEFESWQRLSNPVKRTLHLCHTGGDASVSTLLICLKRTRRLTTP